MKINYAAQVLTALLPLQVSCSPVGFKKNHQTPSHDIPSHTGDVPSLQHQELLTRVFPTVSDQNLVLSADGQSCAKAPKSNLFADQYITPSAPGSVCHITDAKTLADCFSWNNSFSYEVFQFDNDVACTGDECCPGGGAPIRLGAWGANKTHGVGYLSNKTIKGQGHTLSRKFLPGTVAPQKKCGVFNIYYTSNVRVENLSIDDGLTPAGVDPLNGPNVANIVSSKDVVFDGVSFYNVQAPFVAQIQRTAGFSFINSLISNASNVGIWVGRLNACNTLVDPNNLEWVLQANNSANVNISNSIFSGVGTNGIAIEGLVGGVVENNIVTGNHRHGQFPVPALVGPSIANKAEKVSIMIPSTGGSLSVGSAIDLDLRNNLIADGQCDNCNTPSTHAFEVGGVELGVFKNVNVSSNTVLNTVEGLWINVGSDAVADSSFKIENNLQVGGEMFFWNNEPGRHEPTLTANNYLPEPNRGGEANYIVYRTRKGGTVLETPSLDEAAGGTIDYAFQFSSFARVGADRRPIFRCFSGVNDYPSRDPRCGDATAIKTQYVLGYSFEPSVQNLPVFHCRKASGVDFISWAANCEGQTRVDPVKPLAYASKVAIPANNWARPAAGSKPVYAGNLDGIWKDTATSKSYLSGWVCRRGLSSPAIAQVAFGGVYNFYPPDYLANAPSGSVVSNSCQAAGNHRFLIPITAEMKKVYGGTVVHAYAKLNGQWLGSYDKSRQRLTGGGFLLPRN